MNAIMGMTSLVMRRTMDARLRSQLDRIDQSSHHLLGVINNILDISKIEAERLSLEQVDFTLDDVLNNLSALIGHKVAEKGLGLHIEVTPEDARRQIKGDPLRLGQILLNLAGNAVKFTDAGSISVRVRVEELGGEELRLQIDVKDTGIGIAAEDQKRLFTAFEQADGSMTRKYGGTGLGLAISRRLARMMGGDIEVSSRPGAGSSFRLHVTLQKATGAVAPAPTSGPGTAEARLQAVFGGTRILLAEDEPTNRDVARWLLEDRGLVVDLAEDGLQAVDLAGQTRYALILMDMQMPNLNGVDATRAIRALPGHERTPILAMTANAFAEDRQVCLEAGMDDHIGKPVDPDLLFEVLLHWLDRARG
jgi:CheY-like chemotaxis protein